MRQRQPRRVEQERLRLRAAHPAVERDELLERAALLGDGVVEAVHQDVGGMTPGSIPTNATEIFQEGIRIPPLKLREAGVEV